MQSKLFISLLRESFAGHFLSVTLNLTLSLLAGFQISKYGNQNDLTQMTEAQLSSPDLGHSANMDSWEIYEARFWETSSDSGNFHSLFDMVF